MDSDRSARAARRRASYGGGVVSFGDERDADIRFWHTCTDAVRLNTVLEMALAETSDENSSRLLGVNL